MLPTKNLDLLPQLFPFSKLLLDGLFGVIRARPKIFRSHRGLLRLASQDAIADAGASHHHLCCRSWTIAVAISIEGHRPLLLAEAREGSVAEDSPRKFAVDSFDIHLTKMMATGDWRPHPIAALWTPLLLGLTRQSLH